MHSPNGPVLSLLHEKVRDWILAEGWAHFRPFQEDAIRAIVRTDHDVLISAPTASGKTEAAVLPTVSRVLASPADGVRLLYIVPTKALANDLDRRIDSLSGVTEISVHRWHGDVAHTAKLALIESPSGILLVTPESLEAILMKRGNRLGRLFGQADAIIIDEVHTYLGTERGAQLQSLLGRLELAIGRRVRRIGLSATVGDPNVTADYLRPTAGHEVVQIRGEATRDVEIHVSGATPETLPAVLDLMKRLAGRADAVFPNSRAGVELWTDKLQGLWPERRVLAHHGNLSKEHRESVEAALRDAEVPTTVICTSTLELGVDIGSLDHVTQIGPPPSVAALHQRAGRAGRRSRSARTDVVVLAPPTDADSTLEELLRVDLVQAIASVQLQREGWCETPSQRSLHLSTLVQQIVSAVVQKGAATEAELFATLCSQGIFARVTRPMFTVIIQDLLGSNVLRHCPDEPVFLRLDDAGEKLIGHYHFYAAFQTPVEYRVIAAGQQLGSIPVTKRFDPSVPMLFAGRRWRVIALNERTRTIELASFAGGEPPVFIGEMVPVTTEVRQRMFSLYTETSVPELLNATARELLDEARTLFSAYRLDATRLLQCGPSSCTILPWVGDQAVEGLGLLLAHRGVKTSRDGFSVVAQAPANAITEALHAIVGEMPDPDVLLPLLDNVKNFEKHHRFLCQELVRRDYLSQKVDLPGAVDAARDVLASIGAGRRDSKNS